MTRLSLPAKVLAVEHALANVPHAFGGAIALAYYAEPRATIDIDLNVFVSVAEEARVFAPLAGLGVHKPAQATRLIGEDGQIRLDFDGTPLDLFFAYDEFHTAAAGGSSLVPFADSQIAVLSASHLTVCKTVFDRPKDWVDIEAMVEQGAAIDLAEVMRWVGRIVGDTDRRYKRIAAVLSHR